MANFRKVLFLVVVLLAGVSAWAQQITGSIRGPVTDPSGAVVQGATVSAKQIETGFTRTATTGRDGEYVLLELPVGHYQLQVEAKTFQKYVQEGITLNVNETAAIPVHLVVGSEGQQIQVTADAQLIHVSGEQLEHTWSDLVLKHQHAQGGATLTRAVEARSDGVQNHLLG